MATTRTQAPNSLYTEVLSGPGLIEPQGVGEWRVVVNPTQPIAGFAAYHKIRYPAGQFIYSGSEKVWMQEDTDSGHDSYLIVTAIV